MSREKCQFIQEKFRMSNAENVNLEKLLQMGITAARDGNQEGARVLLQQVLEENSKIDRAWFWLAVVADNDAQRRQYLQTTLKINPNNKAAKKALRKIQRSRTRGERRTLWLGIVVILMVLVIVALLVLVAVLSQ
jgi:Tfp pilus assembly protein PilF